MSLKGSLMPYENNNETNRTRLMNKSPGPKQPQIQPKQLPVTTPSSSSSSSKSTKCFRAHFNSLWSVWYGLCATALQTYIAFQCAQRFLAFAALPWPNDTPPPKFELHAYLGLAGTAVLLLPFFLTAAVFKIGNLANDGFKLGRHLSTCTADPPSVLLGAGSRLGSKGKGVFKSLWQHGGPTAPFLHLATAFCLLLPKLLMEARLIQADMLPKENIWRTDLDFLVVHHDRLVVLSFMTSSPTTANSSIPFLPTPLPFLTSSIDAANGSLTTASTLTTTPNASGTHPEAARLSLPKPLHEMLGSELDNTDWGPISAEFLNYALALLVYAVRYPAVFWNTNKAFGTLFSFQLLANGAQSLLAYAGICVLYKVQVVGVWTSLPHRVTKGVIEMPSPFLLNAHITLALFVLSNVLILASSLVLYLYGYGRFNAFLNAERARRVIILRDGRAGGSWGYFTHCAALCVLLSIAVCNAPLLYDCTMLYRHSLDGAILACVVGAILHLFLWVLLWLVLTIKRRWVFKLRVTVGRAAVRSARSVKLVTEVDLISSSRIRGDESSAPLLVVGNGRTYTVHDSSPKKSIMSVIQKAALDRKARAEQAGDKSLEEGEEQIYWLRPKTPSLATTSPGSSTDRLAWLNRKLSPSPSGAKPKVTFDESAKKGKSPKYGKVKIKGQRGMERPMSESEDDGDYATLREIPLMSSIAEPSDDSVSEDNKLLDCAMRDDTVTYARTNRDLTPGDYGDPSPLLTPEPPESPERNPVTVTVHSVSDEDSSSLQAPVTPHCLRRADSGVPLEEPPRRSGSVSTESSGGSPPCGNHSETSSGVSSGREPEPRRATSVDDLALEAEHRAAPPPWRSFSLQRNVAPPTAATPPQPVYGFHGAGRPAVLVEASDESTVVIRRKQLRPKTTEGVVVPPAIKEEPFGRSTNMRMTSFTDNPDSSRPAECYPSSSSTLPHYPTQAASPAAQYPHCSTMPLPNSTPPNVAPPNGGSCHLFPRHHTTIPTHHNGVRLFGGPNPFVKRFPPFHHQPSNGRPHPTMPPPTYVNAEMAHHSFSQIVQYSGNDRRDSANFSMASSGGSDQYLPHEGQHT